MSVCYKCEERELGCHEICVRYNAYILSTLGEKSLKEKESKSESQILDYISSAKDRMKKRRNLRGIR